MADGLAGVPLGSRTLQIAFRTRRFFVLGAFTPVSSVSRVTTGRAELGANTADVRRTSHVISRHPKGKLNKMLCPLSKERAMRFYEGMVWREVHGSSVCWRRPLR